MTQESFSLLLMGIVAVAILSSLERQSRARLLRDVWGPQGGARNGHSAHREIDFGRKDAVPNENRSRRRVLRRALENAGLDPVPQYTVFGRYLDLALVDEKIDIEVDGQAWHLDRNGCTKADDIHRDLILESNGWRVVRFWHHEVEQDVNACVSRVIGLAKIRA